MRLFKTDLQLIEEIHQEFDTAQDRLLQQAEAILKTTSVPETSSIENLASRLQSVGFSNVPVVKQAEKIKTSKKKIEEKLVKTKEEAELIEYYQQTYPFLKFLTEEELNRICEKYNLIHAPVANYIKPVPEKNLRDIENAQQIKDEDSVVYHLKIELAEAEANEQEYNRLFSGLRIPTSNRHSWIASDLRSKIKNHPKGGLFIAAPKSHFNLQGLTKQSKYGFFNIVPEPKDPIVFQYVRGGMIAVITKWGGPEVNDPLLVNPINN